jgi:hypothetical protein
MQILVMLKQKIKGKRGKGLSRLIYIMLELNPIQK